MEWCFLLTSPLFLQYYKPQYNAFKIVFDNLEFKETKHVIHFLLLKAHPH